MKHLKILSAGAAETLLRTFAPEFEAANACSIETEFGNAGVIEAEVVLISRKSADDKVDWVYLDIGKFGGLAETMDESIRYPIRTARDGRSEANSRPAHPRAISTGVRDSGWPAQGRPW